MLIFISVIVFLYAVSIILGIRQRDISGLAMAERHLAVKHDAMYAAQSILKQIEQEWSLAFDGFCAIDVETTGLASAKCKIIQIAIVTFEGGRVANAWSRYLNPGVKIPVNATKVNNITDIM
jgi:hypothetical protein